MVGGGQPCGYAARAPLATATWHRLPGGGLGRGRGRWGRLGRAQPLDRRMRAGWERSGSRKSLQGRFLGGCEAGPLGVPRGGGAGRLNIASLPAPVCGVGMPGVGPGSELTGLRAAWGVPGTVTECVFLNRCTQSPVPSVSTAGPQSLQGSSGLSAMPGEGAQGISRTLPSPPPPSPPHVSPSLLCSRYFSSTPQR